MFQIKRNWFLCERLAAYIELLTSVRCQTHRDVDGSMKWEVGPKTKWWVVGYVGSDLSKLVAVGRLAPQKNTEVETLAVQTSCVVDLAMHD